MNVPNGGELKQNGPTRIIGQTEHKCARGNTATTGDDTVQQGAVARTHGDRKSEPARQRLGASHHSNGDKPGTKFNETHKQLESNEYDAI